MDLKKEIDEIERKLGELKEKQNNGFDAGLLKEQISQVIDKFFHNVTTPQESIKRYKRSARELNSDVFKLVDAMRGKGWLTTTEALTLTGGSRATGAANLAIAERRHYIQKMDIKSDQPEFNDHLKRLDPRTRHRVAKIKTIHLWKTE